MIGTRTFAGTLALAWAALPSGQADAQEYPTKPVRAICWSAAGSPLDAMMRQMGKQVGEIVGQTVPVENRSGGSGAVAMAYTMSQPADGYTVLSTTASMTFTMASGQIPFGPDQFTVLRALQAEPSAVAVRKDSPYTSLKQVVDHLAQNPNGLRIGGYASAGFHQFVFYRLQEAGAFRTAWIPFEGGNEAALALLGGHIDVAVMTPSSATSQVKSGEIRLLGISTEGRDPYFPDTPTFREQGYDVVESIWRGVMVKKGTPQPVVDTLVDALKRMEATDEWKAFMTANMQSPLDLGVDRMQTLVAEEVASRRKFLQDSGFLK